MSIRVYELAKELGISAKRLISELGKLKIEVSSHMATLDDETAEIVKHELTSKIEVPTLELKFPLSVKELAVKLSTKPSELIKKMMKMGIFATINQPLEEDLARVVAKEYGFQVKGLPTDEELLLRPHKQEDTSGLKPHAPVVTLMGHVDHGKTSLLDYIRRSKIVEKETGGITQHIGAYEVFLERGNITFLDTPGHEAFTAMRARGANATDIVVLVVAADDGVMPQTQEAIDHARAAGVPIVVALNKIDKPNANIDKVKQQLKALDLVSEDWGGSTIVVGVSAKTGEGIDKLLEMILLEAEMLELKANPQAPAKGVVIEGRLSKGAGPCATVLVQNGTLRLQDVVVVGLYYGRIKSMINDRGQRIQEASASLPVEIFGISGVPQAGDLFFVVEDEKKAKELSLKWLEHSRQKKLEGPSRVTLEDLYQKVKGGKLKQLKVIIKADVQGSLEALEDALGKFKHTGEVELQVIHKGVGLISESDVMLAAASDAIIIGFHVTESPEARRASVREGVEIRLYRVIYEAIEELRQALEGMLEPKRKEIFQARAEVRQVFNISKVGNVAGCLVVKGRLHRKQFARLIRNDQIQFEGKIASLKRFKDDVREVNEGMECGIALEGFGDYQVGDIIETFEVEKVVRKLEG